MSRQWVMVLSVLLLVVGGGALLIFKQQQDETTYSMSCFDFSCYSFLYPSDISHDLAFVFENGSCLEQLELSKILL
jgi:hypothetical protein